MSIMGNFGQRVMRLSLALAVLWPAGPIARAQPGRDPRTVTATQMKDYMIIDLQEKVRAAEREIRRLEAQNKKLQQEIASLKKRLAELEAPGSPPRGLPTGQPGHPTTQPTSAPTTAAASGVRRLHLSTITPASRDLVGATVYGRVAIALIRQIDPSATMSQRSVLGSVIRDGKADPQVRVSWDCDAQAAAALLQEPDHYWHVTGRVQAAALGGPNDRLVLTLSLARVMVSR